MLQIDHARAFLSLKLPATRLVKATFLAERLGAPVFLKLESELPTGSFKVRGALFALASRQSEFPISEVDDITNLYVAAATGTIACEILELAPQALDVQCQCRSHS